MQNRERERGSDHSDKENCRGGPALNMYPYMALNMYPYMVQDAQLNVENGRFVSAVY